MTVDPSSLPERQPFIMHVNHASLLLGDGGQYLLTDPWYISPAFGSWTQHPSPPAETIREIFEIPADRLSVLVSHGHDDHFDDYLFRHQFSRSLFLIPDFGNGSLRNRVERATGSSNILPIGDAPLDVGPFRISRYIDRHFTGYDAIVVIEFASLTLVHANDNWHLQPADLIHQVLTQISADKPIVYCSQVGIADAFPVAYPQIENADAASVIRSRVDEQCAAVSTNALALGANEVFVYANESRISQARSARSVDPPQITSDRIDEFNRSSRSGVRLRQLRSGMYVDQGGRLNRSAAAEARSLLDQLVQALEARFNDHMSSTESTDGTKARFVHDATGSEPRADPSMGNTVVYSADPICWQRILTGQLTLEALSIGGTGTIFKFPPQLNIRHLHHELSKFAYRAQHELLTRGLGWLLGGPSDR